MGGYVSGVKGGRVYIHIEGGQSEKGDLLLLVAESQTFN